MRTAVLALVAALAPGLAAADPITYREDDVIIAMDILSAEPFVSVSDAALAKCTGDAAGSAVFYIEVDASGRITAAHVHGAGKLDACLARALGAGAASAWKKSMVVLGHLDIGSNESPRISTTAVELDAHGAPWQVTATKIGYTANRARDIAQALDGVSPTIAACAGKRGRGATPSEGSAWLDGRGAVVRLGPPAYDACVARALAKIELPAPESAMWLELSVAPPAEALKAHSAHATTHDQDLRDALTTAVRSRKLQLEGCLDGRPGTRLVSVAIALRHGKASITKVSTGDAAADACVRDRLRDIAIDEAAAADALELDVTLDQ